MLFAVKNTHSFRSQQNEWILTIIQQVNCKSDFVIYILECKKCQMQYVGNAETDFNSRLNNHRKDVYKLYAISSYTPFCYERPYL